MLLWHCGRFILTGWQLQVLDEAAEEKKNPWKTWRPLSAHVDKLTSKKNNSERRKLIHRTSSLNHQYNCEFSRHPVSEVLLSLTYLCYLSHPVAILPDALLLLYRQARDQPRLSLEICLSWLSSSEKTWCCIG